MCIKFWIRLIFTPRHVLPCVFPHNSGWEGCRGVEFFCVQTGRAEPGWAPSCSVGHSQVQEGLCARPLFPRHPGLRLRTGSTTFTKEEGCVETGSDGKPGITVFTRARPPGHSVAPAEARSRTRASLWPRRGPCSFLGFPSFPDLGAWQRWGEPGLTQWCWAGVLRSPEQVAVKGRETSQGSLGEPQEDTCFMILSLFLTSFPHWCLL